MLRAAAVVACVLAIGAVSYAEQAQAQLVQRPVPAERRSPNTLVEQPLPKQYRDGSFLAYGVRFHFGDPPRAYLPRGDRVTVVAPRDGPEGQEDRPGLDYCQRSLTQALEAFAKVARERGGNMVVDIASDPALPGDRHPFTYVCDGGRVKLTGTVAG